MRLFGLVGAKRVETEAESETLEAAAETAETSIYPGATCCMVVGEPFEDAATGATRRTLCSAPATRVWFDWQECYDRASNEPGRRLLHSATAALPFCAEHLAAWEAARGNVEGMRETFPVGMLTRLEREANEQAQSVVDTIMAAMTRQLRDVFSATPVQLHDIHDAIRQALEAEQRRVFKPVSTTPGQPHKPVLLA